MSSDLRTAPVITEELLARLDVPGPRYTSYPTADRFVEAFGPAEYQQALWARASGSGTVGGAGPFSVYVHIPFCESVCYYCACNKVITKHHERAGEYLDALALEIGPAHRATRCGPALVATALWRRLAHVLSDEELTQLMAKLKAAFRLQPEAEVSIESTRARSPPIACGTWLHSASTA